jgi:hypothetical protein
MENAPVKKSKPDVLSLICVLAPLYIFPCFYTNDLLPLKPYNNISRNPEYPIYLRLIVMTSDIL